MPPVLHEGCKLSCGACGASISVPAPRNNVLKVGTHRVLLKDDLFVLGPNFSCKALQQKFPPCSSVVWRDSSKRLIAASGKALLQDSTGLVGSGPPGVVAIEWGRVRIEAGTDRLKDG